MMMMLMMMLMLMLMLMKMLVMMMLMMMLMLMRLLIENPHALLRTRACMTDIEHLRNTVTYCHYGYDYRKETDLWTNIDVGELPRCTICTPCRWMKIMGRHPRVAQAGGGHDDTTAAQECKHTRPTPSHRGF